MKYWEEGKHFSLDAAVAAVAGNHCYTIISRSVMYANNANVELLYVLPLSVVLQSLSIYLAQRKLHYAMLALHLAFCQYSCMHIMEHCLFLTMQTIIVFYLLCFIRYVEGYGGKKSYNSSYRLQN